MSTIRLMNDGTRTEIVTDAELAAAKAGGARPAAPPAQPAPLPTVATSIAVSVTAACSQCHVNVGVNAIATEAHCPECNHRIALDWALWRDVLSAAVIDGPVAAPNQDHLEALNGGGTTTLIRNYVRKDATCARCKAALPLPRALQGADHGFCICVNCGDKVSLRKVPPELAQLGGLTHIIGEDVAALAGTVTPRQRLFFLWHERVAQSAKGTDPQFYWHYLEDVVCDRNGNIYFVGGGDKYDFDGRKRAAALWSVDALFKPRWQRQTLTTGNDPLEDPELSVTASGFMLMRAKDRHHAYVLSCADGSTAVNLGGREPPAAAAHGFDLKDCTSLTCDIDGTILGTIHDRLLRWTYDGQPLETWPVTGVFGRHHTLQPLYRAQANSEERAPIEASEKYPPDPKEIGNHPYELSAKYGEIQIGFDGMLLYRESNDIAKLDRQGKVVFRAKLPDELSVLGRIQSDAHGTTYVLCEGKHSVRQIVRISALGQVDWIVDGSRPGTPMWDGRHLVVLPHGTMYVFDNNGSARAFNADGSLRFASPKAREADQEAITRRESEAR